jgi:hypothetical protein
MSDQQARILDEIAAVKVRSAAVGILATLVVALLIVLLS